ncbi:MAG: glycogen/starch synthase [Prevotella sp.]|nr:glycogen/starch synthase [Bacteroides sp.]MCM1366360.1 glycogen/starch synthase [Prevotella sp.]MCM1436282.1 glycogen/starch synthase [Prevotella sp.]
MPKKRILYISQEIAPYSPSSPTAVLGKAIPSAIHGRTCEVRTFMPKYGAVNERRNQLHEVIRLSGMNIIIDDNDHPLILKVASLQPNRIQVYFIDNDDYFQKLEDDIDIVGSNRTDNDERAIFFAHGTVETVKKLRWEPDIIQCSGWITALNPLYIHHLLSNDPAFTKTKVIYSPLNDKIQAPLNPEIFRKLREDGIPAKDLAPFKDMTPDTDMLHKMAIQYSDAVIFTQEPNEDMLEFVKQRGIPFATIPLESTDAKPYTDFYELITTDI